MDVAADVDPSPTAARLPSIREPRSLKTYRSPLKRKCPTPIEFRIKGLGFGPQRWASFSSQTGGWRRPAVLVGFLIAMLTKQEAHIADYPASIRSDTYINRAASGERTGQLFVWKNGGKLSARKAQSVERNLVDRIGELSGIAIDATADTVLTLFSSGWVVAEAEAINQSGSSEQRD